MHTNQLIVDEGGECWVSADHLYVTDADSLEDSLHVALKRRPQHGDMYLDGAPLNQGQTFTVRDMKSLKVRSDMTAFDSSFSIFSRFFSHLFEHFHNWYFELMNEFPICV